MPNKVSYRVLWQVVRGCSSTGPQPQLPLPLNHPFMSCVRLLQPWLYVDMARLMHENCHGEHAFCLEDPTATNVWQCPRQEGLTGSPAQDTASTNAGEAKLLACMPQSRGSFASTMSNATRCRRLGLGHTIFVASTYERLLFRAWSLGTGSSTAATFLQERG